MAIKASDHFKVYNNPNGPVISTLKRPIIEAEGLYFKDIDGTGTVSAVNDWRLAPAERAAAYVKLMTLDEKICQLFISDWRMGPKYPSACLKGHVATPDESGCVDEAEVNQKTIFGEQHLPGFDKDQYMPAELKDENGKAYAYRDEMGNYYELNFGLSF